MHQRHYDLALGYEKTYGFRPRIWCTPDDYDLPRLVEKADETRPAVIAQVCSERDEDDAIERSTDITIWLPATQKQMISAPS